MGKIEDGGYNVELIVRNLVDKLDENISNAELRESVEAAVLSVLIQKSDNTKPQLSAEQLPMVNIVYERVRKMLNREIN